MVRIMCIQGCYIAGPRAPAANPGRGSLGLRLSQGASRRSPSLIFHCTGLGR
ncbi:MAG: hypothetical protein ACK56I_07725 [bacterium]